MKRNIKTIEQFKRYLYLKWRNFIRTIYWDNLWAIKNCYKKIRIDVFYRFKPWVYVENWSRDCDMCESTSVSKHRGIKMWKHSQNLAMEWAEGPMSSDRISKEEYDNFGNIRLRDRAMEAYENGNGTSIYV